MHKIYCTEIEYIKCFSDYYEDNLIIRFFDKMLGDMYFHNLTYIKQDVSDNEFQSTLQSEIIQSARMGKDFLNIQFDFPYRSSLLDKIEKQPCEITTYDYYVFPIEGFDRLKAREDCSLKKLDSSMLEEAFKLDMHVNEGNTGDEFTKRRFLRRSKVYLQPDMVDNYIFFHNHQAIGHCDLFMNGCVAKIEDFDIAPSMQRKGYGTAMLKEIIKIALHNHAETIYLITDHDDTAKDMYEKSGLSKVTSKTQMLFKI